MTHYNTDTYNSNDATLNSNHTTINVLIFHSCLLRILPIIMQQVANAAKM
jgi:hypothetical protein